MKRFKDWLKAKASDAQMSAKELAEFTSWLMLRRKMSAASKDKYDHRLPGNAAEKRRLTPGDVRDFFGWLHRGMNEARLNDNERKQLNGWVCARMKHDLDGFEKAERSEQADFSMWLSKAMDEANMTDAERSELKTWLQKMAKDDPSFCWVNELPEPQPCDEDNIKSMQNRDIAS
jgi:hypothetical protein